MRGNVNVRWNIDCELSKDTQDVAKFETKCGF